MRSRIGISWVAGLLVLALWTCACGGRTVSKRLARDVIARSPAAVLAKDDVEVVSVIQLGASEAVVETYLHAAFRLERVGGEWVIREVRIGHGEWGKLDDILLALQRIKVAETGRLLDRIAAASDAYWQKNGGLPPFRNFIELSDSLYPSYLTPLIREDAWNHPLAAFRMSPNSIRLVSSGPDGQMGTQDDIELSRAFPARDPQLPMASRHFHGDRSAA